MSFLSAQIAALRVSDIDVDWLVQNDIKLVLLDRDNTIFDQASRQVPSDIKAWIGKVKQAGICVMIVSNNFHSSQIAHTGAELSVPVIDHALKPLPFALRKAAQRACVDTTQTLMVGDQIATDVLAARLARMRSALVEPLSTSDFFWTKALRALTAPFAGKAAIDMRPGAVQQKRAEQPRKKVQQRKSKKTEQHTNREP